MRTNLRLLTGLLVIFTVLRSGQASAQDANPPETDPPPEHHEAPAVPGSTASQPAREAATVNVNDSDATPDDAGGDAEAEARLLAAAIKNLAQAEPPLNALIDAALKQANADVDGARSWQRRVRVSPMMPTVKVSVGYDLEHDESLDRTQDDPDSWGADTDRDLAMQLTAQWELDKLIFHPDELKIYNALADRAERREAIITMIIAYWFERRQLQLTLSIRPPKDASERIRQTLRMKELSACIDALTGGALARNLYSSGPSQSTREKEEP